jgi:type IV pilus assembly protein PilW
MELNVTLPSGKRSVSTRKTQKGVSLVEIMIAVVIGLLLMAGVGQIYISSKQTYRLQDAQSRMQENARYALELLSNDIRIAGYSGCANLNSITPNVIANPPIIALTATSALSGYNASGSSWNPALSSTLSGLSKPPLAGTDAITVQFSQGCGTHLKGNMSAVSDGIPIMAPNTCSISAGNALMVSDCTAADVFRATSVSSSGSTQTIAHSNFNNTSINLSKTYQSDAEIFIFTSRSYYIANGAGGQPALWRLDNNTATGSDNPVELVEGVENMQILYGEDTDNDRVPNRYFTVNSVGNLANVVAVRLSLLIRAPDDNLLHAAQTYNYNGVTCPGSAGCPTDRRLRHVFTTTINLRNRSP